MSKAQNRRKNKISQKNPETYTKQKNTKKTFKVNGRDCLGRQIQDIAKQIHNQTDDDNNEVNLLLWRSANSQVKFFSIYSFILLHKLRLQLIDMFFRNACMCVNI